MDYQNDDIVVIDLSAPERSLLRRGLTEWGGPARCTEELAVAMGFEGYEHFREETLGRIRPLLEGDGPLRRIDWLRALLATEIVFASGVMGSGRDWHITVGLSDIETIHMLREIQRKVVPEVRALVGAGFGTRPLPTTLARSRAPKKSTGAPS